MPREDAPDAAAAANPDMSLLYLDESQNQAFDYEYHSEDELTDKLAFLQRTFPKGPRSILDIGGGNGHFLDRLLSEFPEAEGWIVDISPQLLALNETNPRKHILQGSVERLAQILGGQKFDVISLNWLLHHLVDITYDRSVRNIEKAVELAATFLTERGILMIAENEYQGFFETNVPSHVIYAVTRVQNPVFVKLAGKFFNTAGVGVCFQSKAAWWKLFRRLGFHVEHYHNYPRWDFPLIKRLAFVGLFLRAQDHGHFALRRPGVA